MRTFAIYSILVLGVVGCAAPRDGADSAYSLSIVIKLSNLETRNDRFIAFFDMKNVSDEPMWYDGQELNDGVVDFSEPNCVVQRKRSIGGWDTLPDYMYVECDSGDEVLELAAGQSTRFRVSFSGHMDAQFAFRVGVSAAFDGEHRSGLPGMMYWSETVSAPLP